MQVQLLSVEACIELFPPCDAVNSLGIIQRLTAVRYCPLLVVTRLRQYPAKSVTRVST